MIDPACGSGHFLLGAFARLLDRWHREAPDLDAQARVQKVLDSINGVDLNPFAVAIARFRLLLAALQAAGVRSLEQAPAFTVNLAVGDSLIHGPDPDVLPGMADRAAFMPFTYRTEDADLLLNILQEGTYDVVVGNPPYITVKDKALNQIYRAKYADVCKGTYALTVPFMKLMFSLARPGDRAGWVGQITSNSFMKREFGTKLIEDYLTRIDLQLVADTSGAYIPGHGTPTVIIVGCNRAPESSTVHAVLGIRGEPGRPENPAQGNVWLAIADHVSHSSWNDDWVTVTDLDRQLLASHPWSLSGGGAVEVARQIDKASKTRLSDRDVTIGRTTHTGSDECFYRPRHSLDTQRLLADAVPVVLGEDVRDYVIEAPIWALFPYDQIGKPREPGSRFLQAIWPLRIVMASRVDYEQTLAERGLRWFDHSMFFPARFRAPMTIAFAFIATHNHFVIDRGGKVFNRSAPVIKLRDGATEEDYRVLLGVLNSSTACFWLKQNSHDRGVGGIGGGIGDEKWEPRYEFTGTTLQDYPLPESLPLQRGHQLDVCAQELAELTPVAVTGRSIPSRDLLARAEATSSNA